MKKKLHVLFVMDRSGSMKTIKDAIVDGYNEYVQQVKKDAETLETDVSLLTFNRNVFEHLWCAKPEELQESAHDSYTPLGSTAMYDALGYGIDKFLAMDDATDEGVHYLVYVMSDGDSNDDKIYGKVAGPKAYPTPAMKELLAGCQASKRWTFTYLGCDEKNVNEVAKATGISHSNMAACDYKDRGRTRVAMKGSVNKHAEFVKKFSEIDPASESQQDLRGNFYSADSGVGCAYDAFPELKNPFVSASSAAESVLAHREGTANVFGATSQNCVIGADKTYVRPTHKKN